MDDLLEDLKIENARLKKVFETKMEGTKLATTKYEVINTVNAFKGKYTTTDILKTLDVPRSTYYHWLSENAEQVDKG